MDSDEGKQHKLIKKGTNLYSEYPAASFSYHFDPYFHSLISISYQRLSITSFLNAIESTRNSKQHETVTLSIIISSQGHSALLQRTQRQILKDLSYLNR